VRLIRSLCEIRSPLVHGAPLSDGNRNFLSDEWARLENLVPAVLVEALRALPERDEERTARLKDLYDVDDSQRAEKVKQDFRSIRDEQIRSRLGAELSA
jgi:hypothetical protein